MTAPSRRWRWEQPAALACALLCFVPWLRLPASVALPCLLPGTIVCRRVLGVRSWIRCLILAGPLTLATLPAVTIPAALIAGRPTAPVIVALACAVTLAASLWGRADDTTAADL